MSLIDIQHEVIRLARLEGLSVGKIAVCLRKITKETGQEPVPIGWIRAWLRNAGLASTVRGGCNKNSNVHETEGRGVQ